MHFAVIKPAVIVHVGLNFDAKIQIHGRSLQK